MVSMNDHRISWVKPLHFQNFQKKHSLQLHDTFCYSLLHNMQYCITSFCIALQQIPFKIAISGIASKLKKFVIEAVTYSRLLARKSGENRQSFSYCTLVFTEVVLFLQKQLCHMFCQLKVIYFFLRKKTNIFYGAKLIFRSFATFFGLTIF